MHPIQYSGSYFFYVQKQANALGWWNICSTDFFYNPLCIVTQYFVDTLCASLGNKFHHFTNAMGNDADARKLFLSIKGINFSLLTMLQ